jgi:chitin synthase
VWRSDHSLIRKLALMLEFMYNALNLLFAWFAIANFYIFYESLPHYEP